MRLAVNIDHIATLRNARQETQPDPVTAARLAELSGASGIVCHLREDRRHIKDRDLELLRATVQTKLDLEMAMTKEMKAIAIKTKPDLVTLVPEKRQELTTEGGLDVITRKDDLIPYIDELQQHGIPTSLFIEPTPEAITVATEVGAAFVELHTGKYSLLKSPKEIEAELLRLQDAASLAKKFGLRVVAGHGLNYENTAEIKRIKEIEEVSIGHALIARATLMGMSEAVKEMIRLLQ
ncbi:pyridoxal phosphate biosynthetic protein PdxJ [Chloroherpeton thalassium ATCC 35110]|uniref:Pyridoxine 5'-phosphate synthase n=1 Tax=Chloroherpeton thalassium (strain ATCC 35110 / GB-78) TaxID=517418 RepID=PDXJ_CHLT3|nr:pyridoxine 5'-phosphate synthase [Chloroherpeton thalassium]B3QTV1.1 RecName: Full=Pyridoxine 5'-phosphate synthase; Short=PNP synthase [Chloroherpeton thalassium ATCC 35110]ACF14299.1 pyridoxal phosphate biosynthetic protein PdxJ [Chloroherpeton thalassium ATCC 35110]